jgi:hypothetical protein
MQGEQRLEQVATIQLRDLESRDEGLIIVRCGRKRVALALSLRADGDVEIFMTVDEARLVADALKAAIQAATPE